MGSWLWVAFPRQSSFHGPRRTRTLARFNYPTFSQAALLRQQAKPQQIQENRYAYASSSSSASCGNFIRFIGEYSLGPCRLDREKEMPTLTKLYSMEEAALHNTPDDCWVVVDGKIYDVTKYLDDHPGGAVLLAATGKDATDEFEDAGHSKDAKEQMQDYFIGELDMDEMPDIPEMEILQKEQDMDFASKLVTYAVQYWAIPVATVGISAVVAILYARRK